MEEEEERDLMDQPVRDQQMYDRPAIALHHHTTICLIEEFQYQYQSSQVVCHLRTSSVILNDEPKYKNDRDVDRNLM